MKNIYHNINRIILDIDCIIIAIFFDERLNKIPPSLIQVNMCSFTIPKIGMIGSLFCRTNMTSINKFISVHVMIKSFTKHLNRIVNIMPKNNSLTFCKNCVHISKMTLPAVPTYQQTSLLSVPLCIRALVALPTTTSSSAYIYLTTS